MKLMEKIIVFMNSNLLQTMNEMGPVRVWAEQGPLNSPFLLCSFTAANPHVNFRCKHFPGLILERWNSGSMRLTMNSPITGVSKIHCQ